MAEIFDGVLVHNEDTGALIPGPNFDEAFSRTRGRAELLETFASGILAVRGALGAWGNLYDIMPASPKPPYTDDERTAIATGSGHFSFVFSGGKQ